MDVNAFAPIAVTAAFLPYDLLGVYGASKAALSFWTGTLRRELAGRVRDTLIEPAITDTDLQAKVANPTVRDAFLDFKTSIEPLHADDIAELIAFAATRPAHMTLGRLTAVPAGQPQ